MPGVLPSIPSLRLTPVISPHSSSVQPPTRAWPHRLIVLPACIHLSARTTPRPRLVVVETRLHPSHPHGHNSVLAQTPTRTCRNTRSASCAAPSRGHPSPRFIRSHCLFHHAVASTASSSQVPKANSSYLMSSSVAPHPPLLLRTTAPRFPAGTRRRAGAW